MTQPRSVRKAHSGGGKLLVPTFRRCNTTTLLLCLAVLVACLSSGWWYSSQWHARFWLEDAWGLVSEDAIQQTHIWHAQQLAFASRSASGGDSAPNNSAVGNEEEDRRLRLASSKLLLSREPWKETLPTQVTGSESMTDSTFQCNLYQPEATLDSKTTLTRSTQHQWALARIAVVIRPGHDAVSRLTTWVTHYLHAVPADALVLVTYQGDADKLNNGNNPWKTSGTLTNYVSRGIHVWNCYDTMAATGHRVVLQLESSQRLLQMQTKVLEVYQNDSAFLMPLQLHELLAVSSSQNSLIKSLSVKQQVDEEVLVWDASSVHKAFTSLLIANSSQTIAMESIVPIPGDCPILSNSISKSSDHENGKFVRHGSFPSPLCALTYAVMRESLSVSCVERNRYFVRGLDVTVTTAYAGKNDLFSPLYDRMLDCDTVAKTGAEPLPSSLVVLQVEHLDFTDWILHSIQQAADHGYTTDVKMEQNCSIKAEGSKAAAGQAKQESCRQWSEFQRHSFSLDKLRSVYNARNCQHPPKLQRSLSASLIPIANVLAHSCG